jgi:hypothetical protein
MPVQSISLTGQVNGTGALNTYPLNNEMFLKVFSGEVLQAFETATVMKPLHTVRTISSGKSAQFPLTGIASAKYHTPGQDIMTEGNYISAIRHAEKVINIDDLLIATTFIDKLDEAKNHYDVRSIYSTELGRALARTMDRNLIGVALNTAGAWTAAAGAERPATVTGLFGSTLISNNDLGVPGAGPAAGDIANTSAAATAFVTEMFNMAAEFDRRNVPAEERYVILTPASYYRIVNSAAGKDLINRDYNPDPSNSFVNAQIASVAGFRMIRSNIAKEVFGQTITAVGTEGTGTGANAATPGHRNLYSGVFTRVKALCFQRQAFGTVKLLDLAMESEYEIRLQGHLMVAKYAMGHGSLRHECAGVLTGAA